VLAAIAKGIVQHFKGSGILFNEITLSSLLSGTIPGINRPHINIVVKSGPYNMMNMEKAYESVVFPTLYLTIQNMNSQEDAQFECLELIDLIFGSLLYRDLGLELQTDLTPVSFNEVTPIELLGAGFNIYEMQYKCSYLRERQPRESEVSRGRILSIVSKYYLDPESGVVDKESRQDFAILNGGNFYIEGEDIYTCGTYATKSDDYQTIIDGGDYSTDFTK
jgi:hypothetical protein